MDRCVEGDQPWNFFGGNDAEAEIPVLWPPHAKSWLIGKDSDAGRDWGEEEKGTTQDEMAGWHHRLSGCELEWTLGVGDGQGGLSCCNTWGRKESHTTEGLKWTELKNVSKVNISPNQHFPLKCIIYFSILFSNIEIILFMTPKKALFRDLIIIIITISQRNSVECSFKSCYN